MEYTPQSHIQQLAEYIKKNLSKGYTLESLKFSLLSQGYSRTSVSEAIELVNKQLAAEVPPIKEKPLITYKIIPETEAQTKTSGILKSFFKWLFE